MLVFKVVNDPVETGASCFAEFELLGDGGGDYSPATTLFACWDGKADSGNFSRVSLAIRSGQRMTGDHVVQTLQEVTEHYGMPKTIQVDNGPEFISKSLDWWAYWN